MPLAVWEDERTHRWRDRDSLAISEKNLPGFYDNESDNFLYLSQGSFSLAQRRAPPTSYVRTDRILRIPVESIEKYPMISADHPAPTLCLPSYYRLSRVLDVSSDFFTELYLGENQSRVRPSFSTFTGETDS